MQPARQRTRHRTEDRRGRASQDHAIAIGEVMSGISTHILDMSCGKPAAGVAVTLERWLHGAWSEVNRAVTDPDGRIAALLPADQQLTVGDYRLRFATGDYFRGFGQTAFYPEVIVQVHFDAPGGKYHLPLLLSPFGYSTYRG